MVQGGSEPRGGILCFMALAEFFFQGFYPFLNSAIFWQPQYPLTMTSRGQLCIYGELFMFIHFEPTPTYCSQLYSLQEKTS